jgi:hypothetical protein
VWMERADQIRHWQPHGWGGHGGSSTGIAAEGASVIGRL